MSGTPRPGKSGLSLKNPAAFGRMAGSRQWRRWAALTEVQVSKSGSSKRKAGKIKAPPIAEAETSASPQHPRAGSKQALLVQLLSRPEGASLDDLLSATGWLPHTTRAALTGLRQRGFEIARSDEEGGSVYRLRAPEPETQGKKPGPRRGSAKAEARASA